MPKKDGGWIGSVLLPLILVSELHDDNFLVMGVSPLSSLTGNEEVIAEEHLVWIFSAVHVMYLRNNSGEIVGADQFQNVLQAGCQRHQHYCV